MKNVTKLLSLVILTSVIYMNTMNGGSAKVAIFKKGLTCVKNNAFVGASMLVGIYVIGQSECSYRNAKAKIKDLEKMRVESPEECYMRYEFGIENPTLQSAVETSRNQLPLIRDEIEKQKLGMETSRTFALVSRLQERFLKK